MNTHDNEGISYRYATLCLEHNVMMDGSLTDERMVAKVSEMEIMGSRIPGSSNYMM